MVAPSFQQFEQLGEPYAVSGKMYVRVRNPKTRTERQVRWYDEREYNKLYPSKAVEESPKEYTCQKHALGFDNGYILLYKGDIEGNLEWLQKEIKCRYTRLWGWYTTSTEELPEIPAGLTTVRLNWESVGKPNGALKPDDIVVKAAESVLYDSNTSDWVGQEGERLELKLTVIANYSKENNYGINHTHIFEDANGNQFGWSTNAKNWPVGEVKKLRGTVRAHETYRNIKTTWLTRCMEVR